MILGKLFEVIFEENIKIIITTNTKLNYLYKDGLQRDQFLPFISIIENCCYEEELSINEDYRLSNNINLERFLSPIDKSNNFLSNKFFRKITKNKNKSIKILEIKGRKIEIENFYDRIVKFKFSELCDKNLGSEDYINIAHLCDHIFIEDIPIFNNENSNQQLRFITLIDILYEKKIRLTLSLEENFDNLGSSIKHATIFKRTVSRMFEMTKGL